MDHIDQWIRLYASPNPEVQQRALRNLVHHTDPRLTSLLLDAVERYGKGGFGGDLVKAITRSGDPGFVEPIIQLTAHPDAYFRALACEILGGLNDSRALDALITCLDDSAMWVRRQAAFALARLQDRRAGPALQQRYRAHPNDDVNVLGGLKAALRTLGVQPDEAYPE